MRYLLAEAIIQAHIDAYYSQDRENFLQGRYKEISQEYMTLPLVAKILEESGIAKFENRPDKKKIKCLRAEFPRRDELSSVIDDYARPDHTGTYPIVKPNTELLSKATLPDTYGIRR